MCPTLMYLIFLVFLLPTLSVSRRYKSRHQTQKVHPACLGSQSVKESVYEWFKESSDLAGNEPIEDEWKQSPLESGVCNSEPETGAGTTVMERSLCPWQWRVNRDEDREPKEILEAYCLCRRSRGNTASLCTPIRRDVAVLKKVLCDSTLQRYEYVRAIQTITVGCHSVLPHVELASPFRFFKSPFGQEV